MTRSSASRDEIGHFSAQAHAWWDENGPFRSLHRLGSLRQDYVAAQAAAFLGKGGLKQRAVLDVGCGGGLLAEPMARMGAKVTGIDASCEAIEVARDHAATAGIAIDYSVGQPETWDMGAYDIVTAMEIVEHVDDIGLFLDSLARLVKPGGLLILSSINRTVPGFLLGVVMAEYVLNWVPPGTHDWQRFRKPFELVNHLESMGFKLVDLVGMVYDPFQDRFVLNTRKLKVNYLLTLRHEGK